MALNTQEPTPLQSPGEQAVLLLCKKGAGGGPALPKGEMTKHSLTLLGVHLQKQIALETVS